MRGNYLGFNISLTACTETNCEAERRTAAAIGSLNANNNGNDSSDNLANVDIFLPIGLSVGLMGLCTAGVVAGLRKFQ